MLADRERNIASFIISDIWSTNKVYHYDMNKDYVYIEYGTGENSKRYRRFYYEDYMDEWRLSKLKKLKSKLNDK